VWLGTAVVTGGLGGLAAAGILAFAAAAVAVPGLALAGVVAHLLIAAANPNRRRAENLARGHADVAAGTTEVLLHGRPGDIGQPFSWTARYMAGILLAAAAPLALLLPAYFRVRLDRITNPDLRPTIVAPGMSFTAPFPPPTFRSVHGWWSATAKVEVLNAAETHAPPTLPAVSQSAWGGHRAAADAPRTTPADLHVGVVIPDDLALEGQTLNLRATLTVVYPTRMAADSLDKNTITVTHEFPVIIAPQAEQRLLTTAMFAGIAAFLVGTVVGGGMLASGIRAVKRQITPPELVRLGGATV
jgi:hypothetical protein